MTFKLQPRPVHNHQPEKIKRSHFFFLIIFCLFQFPGSAIADSFDAEIKNLEEFSTVYQLIKHEYIKNKGSHELIRSAIAGMVHKLDPYSDVLSAEDLKKLELQSVGQYVGIGVTINQSEDKYIVTQVFNDSPAAKAGIKSGSEILKINDTVLADTNYKELRQLLQGEVETELVIQYRRTEKTESVIQVKLHRAIVKANSVECHKHSGEVAVFAIHQFMKHTARELSACIRKMPSSAIILDLRSNPGGLLISAVEVAELFLDIGEIVQVRDKNNKIIERYVARTSQPENQPMLLVLINHYSASAAEILAGAIKDRGSGKLVGEKSFGKGVVQSVFPVGEDLFVKITTALYYTPSEIGFDGIGIEPDYKVTDSISATRYSTNDKVFRKALEIAEKEISAN